MEQQCAYCGKAKSDKEIQYLVASPLNSDILICDQCIAECMEVISDTVPVKTWYPGKPPINDLTPHKIKSELDQYVIGQEHAKKVIATAAYNHMKRLCDRTGMIQKNNILMVGSSGTGKTYLAESLAKQLHVPFVIVDATSFTETGYAGNDVEYMLSRLLAVADGDIELAEKGIIYIDEIDKIGRKMDNVSGRDAAGEGVQSALLKLIEGTDATVPVHSRRKHAHGNNVLMNTKNILFICGGAFESLPRQTESKVQLGFNTGSLAEHNNEKSTTAEMLIKHCGMIPEFMGRVPVIVELDDLTEDDLVRILTEPRNALIKEYIQLFKQDDIDLHFENDALKEIATIAYKRKLGARGLRSILEDVMLDIMYDIPSMPDVTQCTITKDTISNKKPEYKKVA